MIFCNNNLIITISKKWRNYNRRNRNGEIIIGEIEMEDTSYHI